MTITNMDFLTQGKDWPPPEEYERFKKYQENKLLFEAKHDLVYKEWIRVLREDQQAVLQLVLNWHKRISTLWADLLLGEPPRFSSDPDGAVDKYTNDDEGKFLNNCYMSVIDVSRFGDGLLVINFRENQAYIEPTTPQVWIPIVSMDNIQNVQAHVLAWVITEVDDKGKEKAYLRVIIHTKGQIENKLFKLTENRVSDTANYKIGVELPLNVIKEFTGIDPVIETGVDDFLVIPIHNLITSDRVTGFDDYEDVDTILQELEVRFAQLSKILDEHAAPTLAGPDTLQRIDPKTGQASFAGLGRYIPMSPEDNTPEYLTWDPNVDAIKYEIDALMEQLYIISETSPAAFGNLKQGLAESGSALKRLMLAPLAKVNRIRLRLDPAIRKAVRLASELEVINGVQGAQRIESIKVEWNDGLPQDDIERAQVDTQELSGGVASLHTILIRRGFEGEALDEEIERINESKPKEPEIEMPELGGEGEEGEE